MALRCPASKFITHTLSHMSFLFLLAAATFRLDGATQPISFNVTAGAAGAAGAGGDSTPAVTAAPLSSDDVDYAESVENIIKSTFRPANILMTNVQICLMFWIFGLLSVSFACCVSDFNAVVGIWRSATGVYSCACESLCSVISTGNKRA